MKEDCKRIVTIPLDEYDDLKKFKEAYEKGKYVYIDNAGYFSNRCFNDGYISFIEEKEAILKLEESNKKLLKELTKNDNLCIRVRRSAEEAINYKFSKMSIWQFKKWRNEHNND